MDMAFEQKIRERAYGMWLEAGMADGMAHEHWVSAEQAVKHDHDKPTKTRVKAAMMHSDSVVGSSKATTAKKTVGKIAAKKPAAKPRAKAKA
jgi:hypothetical protein